MNNPVWLKVACIVSIVLGSLGLLTAAAGIVGQFTIERIQDSTLQFMEALQGGGLPPRVHEIQQELMEESTAIQLKWRPIMLTLAGVQLLVAGLLLAGGIQALRMMPAGRKLLLAAMTIAVVFEIARIPPTSLMQWQMSKLMNPFVQRLIDASTPSGGAMPAAQRRTVQNVVRSSMVGGILLGFLTTLGMATIKIAFYAAAIWLLRRPHIRAMYTPAAPAG